MTNLGTSLQGSGHALDSAIVADTAHEWDPTSLYVHIPFCGSRCHYCDFTTYVAPAHVMDQYVDNLMIEIELISRMTSSPLKTIFFGGGTPTLLNTEGLRTVTSGIRRWFRLESDCEWTVEANPGTISADKLQILRQAGVNRLSFGAQTFEERLLMLIGRSHDAETIESSVDLAQRMGFQHLSIDLMFGLPEQTLEDVERALERAIQLPLDHVSAYWLKVEPGTPFAKWQDAGLLPLPGEDQEADMFDVVHTLLETHQYKRYEVSNFAKAGGAARHNLVYWHNEPYLAAGVGAHGYARGQRYENVRSLAAYHAHLGQGHLPIAATSIVNASEAMEDTMMLGLRLEEGVSKARFFARHGVPMEQVYSEPIHWGMANGLLQWRDEALTLSDIAWPIANVVFEKFLQSE